MFKFVSKVVNTFFRNIKCKNACSTHTSIFIFLLFNNFKTNKTQKNCDSFTSYNFYILYLLFYILHFIYFQKSVHYISKHAKKTQCKITNLIGIPVISIFALLTITACRPDESPQVQTPYNLQLPVGFPPPPMPGDNLLTNERIELGKKLFFDPVLSRDSTISCATCHLPSQAFADNLPVSVGIHGREGFRNVPSLANVAWHPYFFREGGSPSLETQALGPIADEVEMDLTIAEAAARLRTNDEYVELSKFAYDREPNAYVISRALAAFQRILVSSDAPYDEYVRGNQSALTPEQIRGNNLFFNELQCATCHTGFNFTNYNFENNGLYENYMDEGRARLTTQTNDIGKFKVSSLRNVALTPPYMHDGSLPTLESVIEHYNSGGSSHANKSPLIQPLNLTAQQKSDIIGFLESLSDETFINNPEYQ